MKKIIKKISFIFFAVITIVIFMSLTVSAEYHRSNGYSYDLTNGYATINSAESDENGEIYIPTEIDGYPVIGVGNSGALTMNASSFRVDSENEYLSTDDVGVLFNKDKTEMLIFPSELSISEYRIPSTVTLIGQQAFEGLNSMGSIGKLIIPDNVTEIRNIADYHSFCENNICAFEVDENNPNFASKDGVLYNKDFTELISIPGGIKYDEFVVPNTVKNISYHGSMCLTIGVLKFESGSQLEEFHGGSFSFSHIEKLILPPSVKFDKLALGDAVFGEVVFEEGREPETIEQPIQCFWSTSIVLPTSVVEIKAKTLDEHFTNVTILNPFCNIEAGFYYIDSQWSQARLHITGYEKSTAHDYAGSSFTALECAHSFGFLQWNPDYVLNIATRECKTCYFTETTDLKTENKEDVEIVAPENPDTDFEVDEIEKKSDNYIIIEEAISNGVSYDFEIIKAFDINMTGKDGVHVQPDGTVKVKFSNDWSKNGVYKVYRVNEDGTLTDMDAYRQGSHLVFDTDHFSIYVIVVENQQTDFPNDEPADEPEKDPYEPTDKPSDEPTDKPSDEPTAKPSDEPTDKPSDEPIDKPDDDMADDCSCNCHKLGFMGFIWKIKLFFIKLFKTNRTCKCNIMHY